MRELGYVEGRDFDMTYGTADFHADRLPQVAAEMVKRASDEYKKPPPVSRGRPS